MTELPDGWNVRRPTLDDQPALLELVHASDIAAVGYPDYSPEDLREALTETNTDLSRDCWVVLDPEGRIVGWAYPSNATASARDFIEVYTWPERGRPAIRPLLELILTRAAERGAEFGHRPYEVRAGAVPSETAYIAELTAAGFGFLKQHARMQIPLDGVSATPPESPEGVTIRNVRADDDDEMRAFHGVIEQAFLDSDHRTAPFDAWRKQASAFEEWFVAEVDGVVAGALESSYDSDTTNDEGWVKRLGVLAAYRKRGLGEALLRRAFATYAGQGRAKAGLGVDLANPTKAARLYLAVGMKPLYEANIYQKIV